MRWSLAHAARACAADAVGDARIDVVVVDSRLAAPGSLFVAVRGERLDGHEFASEAAAAGAAVVCERGRLPVGAMGFEVDDTLAALRMLTEARRSELAVPVVAITGSNGKTTTKDLTAAVLGPGTHAAPASFNNEVGVPLTILGCPDDASALVVEVGSRGRGHIAALAGAVAPDVSVITNIGRAHLETFGSVDGVREAKWELVEALGPDGVAILPAAESLLTSRATGAVLTFGEEPDADVRASGIVVDAAGVATFVLSHLGAGIEIRMGLPGRHQPLNAAAAVAAAVAVGRPFLEAASRLVDARVSRWRMEPTVVAVPGGDVTVVNDAYNANPDSVESALRTVAAMPGRHHAVLGKMHELGADEAEAHREVGALAARLGFQVVVVGDDPGIAAGAGEGAVSFGDVADAVAHLRSSLAPGDVVLVKASRAAGLEAVALGVQEVFA